MSASGVPYATWDGGQYVVRVDLEPDDAREVGYALGSQDRAFPLFIAAADRVDELRRPAPSGEDAEPTTTDSAT